eukprot:CAMPEP_0114559124 /NCGR_PEP_ID=MMETSP0114-20121206/10756_1 /TAXON_ID=31324 /ORGANISM="Goniomonas sp, Strain m" /LENGTH=197 /DNA_ID=CAMNT_0001744577 /DNA_START=6 /DNA_END=599 /DNA_ORIENTATION=-
MFFGITLLGAPSPYDILKYDSAACVSTADFLTAFRSVASAGQLVVNQENIAALLRDALGGDRDPLQDDIDFFLSKWPEGHVINQMDFSIALKAYHDIHDLKPAKEYVSFRQLRDDKIKHKRPIADPHQSMRHMATTNQEYGWGGAATTKASIASNLSGNIFAHKPSFLSFYSEFVTCAEDGRDFVPGPTLRAVEHGP